MDRVMKIKIVIAAAMLGCMAVPVLAQAHKPDDVSLELIGQVNNPSPTSTYQVGYLSYINGIDNPIFSGAPQNEATASFTFAADEVTTRVIANGPLRIINREEGVFTIYYDNTPDGNFADPTTFRDGQPVMTANVRHQVVLDTLTSSFTATFVLTVTSNDSFIYNGQTRRLGKVGDKLRLTFFGHGVPPTGNIAGFVVGSSLIKPEN